jgi:hypothetical protein
MKVIMGVDPGGTTGWALLRGGNRSQGQLGGEEIVQAEILADMVVDECVDVVVIEDFVLYPGKEHYAGREGLAPVRITAYLEAILYERGWEGNVKKYMASDSKRVVKDDRLRQLGLWVEGMQHARDAWRQVVLFCRKYRVEM